MIEDIQKFFKENGGSLRKLYLKSHADNDTAHAFYRKMGMDHDSTLRDHFRTGLNEWVFTKFFK
jgi:RimJ/RimL family protein N-acetyltransferase